MLILVSSQRCFEKFIQSVEWHDGYVQESHFVCRDYNAESILRLLVLPDCGRQELIELVFYEPRYVNGPSSGLIIDCLPEGTVQRRNISMSLATCEIKATCMAYRALHRQSISLGEYFADVRAYDSEGNLIAPYDLDWRTEMDVASAR
jgi:hypothetical protein